MKLKRLIYFFLIVPLLFSYSCTTYKNVPYFQDLKRDSTAKEAINNYSPLTVQPGDLLAIHVNSLNHVADQIFNYNLERPSGLVSTGTSAVATGAPSENTVFGYLVDNNGNIKLPMIGEVKASGMTTSDLAADLQNKLTGILTNAVVDIRIENFKVSVIGDVKNPGTYSVQNEKITLTEALALAGDLNTTGLRQNVLLVREIDGQRQYINFDLRSKEVFHSPYFYLKNNDIIYVQPNRDRVASSDSALARISLVLAALSIVAIYLTERK
jgi:polysaccharide biosynthesis/export protein